MHIAIIAFGSRGDVQPYIALGLGLQQAGHQVRIVTHENFGTLVQSHGLEFRQVRGNVQEVSESKEMRELIARGNFFAISARMATESKRAAVQWAEDGLAASQGIDLLIAGMGGMFSALGLGEKLGIPLLQAHLLPMTPTSAFPSLLLPASVSRLGGWFNKLSHQFTRQMIWQMSRAADTLARKQVLGLVPAPFLGPYQARQLYRYPVLYGFSPSVIPKPPDWQENTHVTGYWFLDSAPGWTPPPELVAFLENGTPPVYIGFGSMGSRKPEETTALVLGALAQTGQRGILLSGWDGLRRDQLPDSVFMLDSIPHSWLFPRVAAVIHHGGAGTTAAGLRAGVPAIVTPFFGDQPFWGQRVADAGVGTAPIPRKHLTVDNLAAAIKTVTSDAAMRERAARLGEKIRAENGVAHAVEIIQAAVGR